ncbi:MAG: nucleotidyl transferase AbiEii/AbiGii toxin family protein [Planctomycetota bacterium]
MPINPYLHEHPEFSDLIRIVADERRILPLLVEKDYWIMHCLYGLNSLGWQFQLKGGTSLSKGFGVIERFSEDIDIRIDEEIAGFKVFCGKNQDKEAHVASRRDFFDWVAENVEVPGVVSVDRDYNFDTEKMRSGGVRLQYQSHFTSIPALKTGILFELGFDKTGPSEPCLISSWAYDRAQEVKVALADNRALEVECYHPGFTLVEKLQAVSTKFRQQQDRGNVPENFIRHYYDKIISRIGQDISRL